MSIFKVITHELDQRVRNEAYRLAGALVERQKELVYARSGGHWSDSNRDRHAEEVFWLNSRSAHAEALLDRVRAEVETYTIKALKTAAEQWEAEFKELTK